MPASQNRAEVVTPHHSSPYYPALLANGCDGILIDYTGSTTSTFHGHNQQHQGSPTGWYKVCHRGITKEGGHSIVHPILQSGHYFTWRGLPAGIDDYAQSLNTQTATLTTRVRCRGLLCDIVAFITDDHVLVQHYRVLEAPEDPMGLRFVVHPSETGMWVLDLRAPVALELTDGEEGDVGFGYEVGEFSGQGVMVVDRDADSRDVYKKGKELRFESIHQGWSATQYIALVDGTESDDVAADVDRLRERMRTQPFDVWHAQHADAWQAHAQASSVQLPDARLQSVYDVSVYCLRAHQHRDTGAICCGMLPNHWAGGTCCPDDANYTHLSLLLTGHADASLRHLGYYDLQRDAGRKLAAKNGTTGCVYSGWSNVRGEHLTRDREQYLLHTKPSQSGCVALAIYWQWKIAPLSGDPHELYARLEEILDFAYARFVQQTDEGFSIARRRAGDETPTDVEKDTYSTVIFSKVFNGYEEMGDALGYPVRPEYRGLGEELFRDIEHNYREGRLLPYHDAPYGAVPFIYTVYQLPDVKIRTESLDAYLASPTCRTPWGLAGETVYELYRDWPWSGMRVAMTMACLHRPRESFFWLLHSIKYAAANGALPEKIRLDGCPINYWYSSTHGLLVSTVVFALAYADADDTLHLFWGLDGQWLDFEFDGLCLHGGLKVSARVRQRRLQCLRIENATPAVRTVRVCINPAYEAPDIPAQSLAPLAAAEIDVESE